jgi:hypothetical protein
LTRTRAKPYTPAMAKVILNPMFVTSCVGPNGVVTWRTPNSGVAIVKQKQAPGRFKRAYRSFVGNPYATTPNTLYADGEAWKAADLHYTSMNAAQRFLWRQATKRAGYSTYDMYMKQAIPHLLRGYPAPNAPSGTVGWPLKRLTFPADWLQFGVNTNKEALPPLSCQTRGLHYASVAFRKVEQTEIPEYNPMYETRGIVGYDNGFPAGWGGVLFFVTLMMKQGTWYPYMTMGFDETVMREWSWLTVWPPVYVKLEFLPYQIVQGPGGPSYVPYGPLPLLFPVCWLNQNRDFVHWPRAFPSKKEDAVPQDRSWLTTWTNTPSRTYLPYTPSTVIDPDLHLPTEGECARRR